MKITLNETLGKLKILDDRIYRKINEGIYVGYMKKKATSEYSTRLSKEEFEKKVKASKDSVESLIEQRNEYKSKLIQANAITHLEIANKDYTIATAIERKNSIQYEKEFLAKLKQTYNNVIDIIEKEDTRVKSRLEDKIDIILGSGDRKDSKDLIDTITKKSNEEDGYVIVDPLNLKEIIDKMEEDINNFELEVDTKLTIANSITFIDVN
ncbi:MAG: hypothetical protein ACLR02_12260 [Clostridium sp.]